MFFHNVYVMRPYFLKISFSARFDVIMENCSEKTKQNPHLSLTLAKKFGVFYSWVVCTEVLIKEKNELIFESIHA